MYRLASCLLVLCVVACVPDKSDPEYTGPDSGVPGTTPPADARPRPDAGNREPIAIITSPTSAGRGDLVNLYGTNSYDPDGDPLTYAWRLEVPVGSVSVLTAANTIAPTFTTDVDGTYRVRLTVNDGTVDSVPHLALVVVGNQPPTAVAAGPATAVRGAVVNLDGSGSSDPDGDAITYAWSLQAPTSSAAVLAGADTAAPSFTPDLPGTYRAVLTVNDGLLSSVASSVDVLVENALPVVDAGTDQTVEVGSVVTLSGTANDADGDSLTIVWELATKPAGSAATLTGEASLTPTFTADRTGEYLLRLSVSDSAQTVVDEVKVMATEDMDILEYRVVDVEYSRSMDRIVLVSSSPARLHVHDPVTGDDTPVDLPLAATAVSVSPSGTRAAVGHDGWVSIVDLQTGTLEKTISVTTDINDLVLADNGYVYCFPRVDQWERIRTIHIETEVETLSGGNSIRAGTLVRLHPTQDAIYGANNGLSPSDIEKYDISSGTANLVYDSPYHGDYSMCGNLWMSRDGLRIFTRCGNVFRSDTDRMIDMTYNGSLSEVSVIQNLDHHEIANLVAVIPGNGWSETDLDTEIQFYGYDFLAYQSSHPVPQFYLGGSFYGGHAKFLFWNNAGTEYYVVAQADSSSGALNDFAVLRRTAP